MLRLPGDQPALHAIVPNGGIGVIKALWTTGLPATDGGGAPFLLYPEWLPFRVPSATAPA